MAELLETTETAGEKPQGSLTADTDLGALLTAILGDAADVHDIKSDLEITLQGIVADPHEAAVAPQARFETNQLDLAVPPPMPLGTTELLVGPLKDDLASLPVTSTPATISATEDVEIGRQLDELLISLQTSDGTAHLDAAAQVQAGHSEVTTNDQTVVLSKKQSARPSRSQKRTKGAWVVTAPAPESISIGHSAISRHDKNPVATHNHETSASTRRDSVDGSRAARNDQRADSRHLHSAGEPDLNAVDGRLVSSAQAMTSVSHHVTRHDELFTASEDREQASAPRPLRERLPMLMVAGIVVVAVLVWLAMRQAA